MRRVMGAWLLFLLLAGPDAVRLVTDRRVPVGGDGVAPLVVVTPPRNNKSATPRTTVRAVPVDFRIHPLRFLSAAPPDSLFLLPGIGPVLAARIADARTGKSPYTTWNDLLIDKPLTIIGGFGFATTIRCTIFNPGLHGSNCDAVAACANTVANMGKKLGHDPALNEHAKIVPGGIVRIKELVDQDYTLVKP